MCVHQQMEAGGQEDVGVGVFLHMCDSWASFLCVHNRQNNSTEPEFFNFKKPKNRFKGVNSSIICKLAGGTTTLYLLGS
jgi:hypothetical protein